MALKITTNINVDFYNKKYIMINAKQYDDSSRWIAITCYDNGSLLNLNADEHIAYIRYKKADGYNVFNMCRINQNGEVLVELTEQMLAADGICYVDLIIVNRGSAIVNIDTGEIITVDDSSVLSTMAFCVDVCEATVDNSLIESSDEYKGLSDLLQTATAKYQEVVQLAESYAHGDAGGIRENENTDNAKYYYEECLANAEQVSADKEYTANCMTQAETFMNNAQICSENASKSAENASKSAENASASELQAGRWLVQTQEAHNDTIASVNHCYNSVVIARQFRDESESNCMAAEAYAQQAKRAVEGLNGAFVPMGTVSFADLPTLEDDGLCDTGYLYHVSDNFVTDESFKSVGVECSAGTNVYWTADGYWDCLVGGTVAGVKGDNEIDYRNGNVNITADNVGAIPTKDIATVIEVTEYLGI